MVKCYSYKRLLTCVYPLLIVYPDPPSATLSIAANPTTQQGIDIIGLNGEPITIHHSVLKRQALTLSMKV